MAKKLKVTLVRSTIGRQKVQGATVRGLGLRRLHQSRILEDTPAVRGMIRKVQHLVHVEPADKHGVSKRVLSLLATKEKRRVKIIFHPHQEYVDAALVGRIAGMMQHWDSLGEQSDGDDEDFLDQKVHELSKETNTKDIVKRQHLIPQAHIKKFLIAGETQVWALHHKHNALRRKAPRDHSFCAHRFWSQSAESAWMKAIEDLFLLALPDMPDNLEDPIVQGALSDYWALCRARLRVFSKPPRAYNFPEITRVHYDQETRDLEEMRGRILYSDRGDETRGIVDALIGAFVDAELRALQNDDIRWGAVDSSEESFILPDFWAGRVFPVSPSRLVQAYKRDDSRYGLLRRAGNVSEVNEFFASQSKFFLIASEEVFLRTIQARRVKR